MAEQFAEGVPEHEFSTAELQGYLLTCKKEPELAVQGVSEWVLQERKEREEREVRDAEKKAKSLEARDVRGANQLHGSLARLGIVSPSNGTGTSGQQLVGSVREPTTSVPIIPNPGAVDNFHASPNHHKSMVNGATDSRSITPP